MCECAWKSHCFLDIRLVILSLLLHPDVLDSSVSVFSLLFVLAVPASFEHSRCLVHLKSAARIHEHGCKKVLRNVARNVEPGPDVDPDRSHQGNEAQVKEPGNGPASVKGQLQDVKEDEETERDEAEDEEKPGSASLAQPDQEIG